MIPAAATSGANNPLWYAARGAGLVTLVLLTGSVVLGIATSVRWQGPDWPRFLLQTLHRNVSLCVLVFLVLHIVTAVLDPFAHLAWLDAVVPFTSSYRPFWLGLGVVASELLLALTATSLLRRRLSFGTWRALHWSAYACWPVALVHGMGTGTDTKAGWVLLIDAACVVAVTLALAWRLLSAAPQAVVVRALSAVVAVGALTVIGVWLMRGPLQAGWAKAAGTPPDLLGQALQSPAPTAAPPSPTPAPPLSAGLRDRVQGTLVDETDGSIRVALTDLRDRALRVVVVAQPDGTATLSVARSDSVICEVPAQTDNGVRATCGSVSVSLSLERSSRGNTVIGELVTAAAG